MSIKKFDKATIKKIAREYIFTDTTYRELAQKYECSDSTISVLMNYDLLDCSRVLYFLADLKATHNRKKNMKRWFK